MKKMVVILVVAVCFLAAPVMAYEFCQTIPDAKLAKVRDAMAWVYKYQENIYDRPTKTYVPNPESKIDFLRGKKAQEIIEAVEAYNAHLEIQAGKAAAKATSASDTVGIE